MNTEILQKRIITEDHKTGEGYQSFQVGDSVIVYDGSYNRDAKNNEHRSGIHPLFATPAKVLLTDCDKWDEWNVGTTYLTKLDLLLLFESGEVVYCSRICVRPA